MNKTEKPSIRFRGFEDAWERRKLVSLCEKFTDGDWIEAKDQSNSGIRLIQTGNIGLGEYIDKPASKKWISEETFERLNCEEVFAGDILISRLPEPAGRACIVPNLNTKMITAVDCTIVRTGVQINPKYLLQHLSSQSYFDEVNICLAGGTRQRISRSNLASFDVPIPIKYEEQEAIGGFLCRMDCLIAHHRHMLEKLTNVKKSMLEKMFPQNGGSYPAVRFKRFTDPWERRKFGDVFEEYSEKNRADLPPLTIIQGSGTIRRDESERALQYDKTSLSSYKVVNEGDLIVHLRSFEGGLEKANSQGIISPAYHTFHGEGVDSRFYYAYFRSKKFIDTDLKPHVYGIRDGRSIDIEGMKTIEIPFTSYPEQKLIGDAIDAINTLITLQRRELEKLQSIRKSLLEKMFV